MSGRKFEVQAGRCLTLDGIPFVTVHPCKDGKTGRSNFPYTEADDFVRGIPALISELAASRAENERLREALVDVMGWYNMTDVAALMSDKGEQAEYHRTIIKARAALGKAVE